MSEDKTIASAADRGSMQPIDKKRSSQTIFSVLLLFLVALFLLVYLFLNNRNNPPTAPEVEESSSQINMPQAINLDLPPIEQPPIEQPPLEQNPINSEEEEEVITVAELRESQSPAPPDPILQRRMNAGISTININQNPQTQDKPVTTYDVVTDNDEQDHTIEYDGQGVAKVSASKIGNRSLIITQGAKLPCTLETALDSTVPGMTSCIVSHDIYSSDGQVRLIDRGSKLNGRYQGDMKRGQARIAILWERLETPEGVIINLSSPSTDPLGRAGASGYVNTHFWERFGNAIMLSLVSDAFQYLDDTRSNRENRFQDTEESTQEMAQIALENEINISPTLYKNQGEEIMVFINKDLSFENVYELGLSQPPTTFEAKLHDSLYK